MDKIRKIRKNQVLSVDDLVEGEVYEYVHEGTYQSRSYVEKFRLVLKDYIKRPSKFEKDDRWMIIKNLGSSEWQHVEHRSYADSGLIQYESGLWNPTNYVRRVQKEDKMKKVIGYGMGVGMNPFTGEVKMMPMRAEMDEETGKVEFFMEKEEEPVEEKETCFLCCAEVEDTREFHLRVKGLKGWSTDSFHLCEHCKKDRQGRIKAAK